MNNTFKRTAAFAMSAMLLTGCGNGSASTAQENTDTNTLRVGMECNYAPYNWSTTTETETSQKISSVDYCDGYDVMIATQLAEDTGKEVEIVKLDWDNLILSLQNNQIDAIIAGMTETEERAKEVDFTTPYYVSTEVVIVKKDSPLAQIQSISELSGFKVQGQMNTIYDTIIDQIDGVIHEPAAETFPASVQALQSGAVDAVTSELPVAKGVCEANSDLTYIEFADGKGFAGAETDASVSIAVRKGDTELFNALQTALDAISEDERQSLIEKAVANQPANE